MDTSANVITTMGIISDEVYSDQGQGYFKNKNELSANGIEYDIIDRIDNSGSDGLQALLLKNGDQYVIAFRGTEMGSAKDWFADLLAGVKNINPQYYSARKFVNDAIKQYGIDKSNLTLTGHSLGGILTQQVGASLGIKGYAYNPWGSDALVKYPQNGSLNIIARVLDAVGIYNSSAESFAKENIVNISYQDEGLLNGDILSNFATGIISKHLGKFIPIFGKNVGLSAHKIGPLNEAIKDYNTTLSHFNSNVTYEKLTTAYLSTAMIHKGQGYEKLNEEFKKIGVFNASNNSLNLNVLTPNSLITTTPNIAELYALVNLNPFIVSNISSNAYNELEKYKDEYSKGYIDDKLRMLSKALVSSSVFGEYYKDYESGVELRLAFDESGFVTDSPHNQFIFGTNKNDTIQNIKSTLDKNTHTKIYTLGGDDTITVLGGSSYIEAGSGNDTIDLRNITNKKSKNEIYADNKNAKDDENGGSDTIYGSAGKDTIYGGKGNDTYYVGDKDIIQDSDGEGSVIFDNTNLYLSLVA
ncbi:putative lipase [Campylobacter blaseri]|uniref:Fungal lipase-like domain-containing protein n=1 Tax=Campylobacter blaseri TaxID=2042961 RepID=A0A2P8QYB5_9BACT|nr:Mbeg1-like protein [Campylobacter blaseri]PSM51235.1 hypothetical protein CQ405_08950 [Campylobacter blaseri]PSM52379.1 hypothetical protein CRN67_08955 [Campylobacter blaseri]QKF86609.1 putative lipase [Campylobacter blaseri]